MLTLFTICLIRSLLIKLNYWKLVVRVYGIRCFPMCFKDYSNHQQEKPNDHWGRCCGRCCACWYSICAVRTDPTTKQPNIMVLGKVVSLEVNHKPLESVKKGQTAAGVAMRLDNPSSAQPTWGRHVDETDNLYSLISRKSIDTLKDPAFRDSVSRDDWLLIKN